MSFHDKDRDRVADASEPLLPKWHHAQDRARKAPTQSRAVAGLCAGLVFVLVAAFVACTITMILVLDLNRNVAAPGEGNPPFPTDLPKPKPGLRNPAYLVRGRTGAVATEAEICSDIGIDVLKDNGTATDAAIAAALCGTYSFACCSSLNLI
jgi:hypothetical protein